MTSSKKILVVGDLAIDVYHKGKVKGMAPEGPHPLVMNPKPSHKLGCAANVARNIKTMFPGISVDLMATVGHDQNAKLAKDMLNMAGIGTSHIMKMPVQTIAKNRLVGDGVILVRWDDEQDDNVPDKLKPIQKMAKIAKNYNVIVFSDYDKGMVYPKLVTAARLNKAQDAIIFVDPKKSFSNYKGVDLIKPNMKELKAYGGLNGEDLIDSIKNILEENQIDRMLLTMSEDGMMLIERTREVKNGKVKFKSTKLATRAKTVVDVCGCGDTVLAAMSGLISTGIDFKSAVKIANVAAGITISKFGTSTVTMDEIIEELKCQDSTKSLLTKLGKLK
jgi:rfaE bifunctional protein kinase chain/domain